MGASAREFLLREPRVTRMQTYFRIDREQQEIRLGDRLLYLPADRNVHRKVGILDEPAGVDEPEFARIPLGQREVTVFVRV